MLVWEILDKKNKRTFRVWVVDNEDLHHSSMKKLKYLYNSERFEIKEFNMENYELSEVFFSIKKASCYNLFVKGTWPALPFTHKHTRHKYTHTSNITLKLRAFVVFWWEKSKTS